MELEARCLLSSGPTLPGQWPLPNPTPSDSILVSFAATATSAQRQGILNALGGYVAQTWPSGQSWVVLGQGHDPSVAVASLAGNPALLYAEADRAVHATSVNPNDPLFPQQWGLSASNGIDATDAWSISEGSPNVIVAVTDTGIDYTHPDLYLNVAINQAAIPAVIKGEIVRTSGDSYISFRDLNSLDANGNVVLNSAGNPINSPYVTDLNKNGYIDASDLLNDPRWQIGVDPTTGLTDDLVGWNYVTGANDPMDDNGHGTHVSGIIGAVGNNAAGIAGVAWNVQILPLKFLDSTGSGDDASAVSAIDYAVTAGAKVINASWGSQGTDSAIQQAVDYASQNGLVFVAAAGNDGTNNDTSPFAPASVGAANEIAVAAVNSSGTLPGWSNYGARSVALAAPGENILSTLPGGGYQSMSGTSMAAPYVSGVVALVAGLDPTGSAADWVNIVESTTTQLAGLQGKTATGGMVDAYKALYAAENLPKLTATASQNPREIDLAWNAVPGATNYLLQRSPHGAGSWTTFSNAFANTTLLQNTLLNISISYDYRLVANLPVGSLTSNIVTAATSSLPLNPSPLYSDTFDSPNLSPAWTFVNGTWSQTDGVLNQTSTTAITPKEAILAGQIFPHNSIITSKVRVDSWTPGGTVNAGVGLLSNPTSGLGYELVFNGANSVQFVNDSVQLGNAYTFNWVVGKWYWFKLEELSGTLFAKVWADGSSEPSNWQFSQTGWRNLRAGAPALDGGSAAAGSGATVSFDEVSVVNAAALLSRPVIGRGRIGVPVI